MAIEGTFGFPGVGTGATKIRLMGINYSAQVWGRNIQISTGQRSMVGVPIWAGPIAYSFSLPTVMWSSAPSPALLERSRNLSAYRTFAVSFGYNLAPPGAIGVTGVARVWINDRLIYDAALPTTQRTWPLLPSVLPDGGTISGGTVYSVPLTVNFTFYPGTEDQLPDAEIVADQGNLACGFRGLAYMVIRGFPVGLLSPDNPFVLPTVRVELIDGMHISNTKTVFASLVGSQQDYPIQADWNNGFIYGWSGIGTSAVTLHKYSIDGASEVSDVLITGNCDGAPYTSLSFDSAVCVDAPLAANGSTLFFMLGNLVGNTQPIVCIDGLSGTIVSQFGQRSNAIVPTDSAGGVRSAVNFTGEFPAIPWRSNAGLALANSCTIISCCTIKAFDNGVTRNALVAASLFNDVTPIPYDSSGVFDATVDYTENFNNWRPLVGGFTPDPSPVVGVAALPLAQMAMLQGGAPSNQDAAYLVATTLAVWLVLVGWRNGRLKWLNTTFVARIGGTVFTTFGFTHINLTVDQIQVDGRSSAVVYFHNNNNVKFMQPLAITYGPPGAVTPMPSSEFFRGILPSIQLQGANTNNPIPALNSGAALQSALRGSNLAMGDMGLPNSSNSTVDIIFTNNGAFNEVGPFISDSINNWLWDSTAQTIYFVQGGTIASQAVNKIAGTVPTLGQLLTWIGLAYGYPSAQLIVDPLLTDPVIGFKIESATDIPTLFGQLAEVYQFSWLESEGNIKFAKQVHGGLSTAAFSLFKDDLAVVKENSITPNDALITMINAPDFAPSSTNFQYFDFGKDYALESQFFLQPQLITGQAGTSTQNVAVPIIMTAAEAYRRATQITVAQYAESVNLQIRLPQKYSMLEPGDVLAITIAPFQYLIQIDETTFNTDHSISILGLNYKYDNTIAVNDQTSHQPGAPLTYNNDAFPVVLDMPLIRQGDDSGQTRCIVYSGVVPLQAPSWHDTYMMFGSTNSTAVILYDTLTYLPDANLQGALANTLFPFQTDVDHTITLVLKSALSANFLPTDDAGLLQGLNAVIIGAPGRWELIYFRDVTVLNSKVVRIGGLLRGRNGTDVHTGDHGATDAVYLISSVQPGFNPGLHMQAIDASGINTNYTYTAMGVPAHGPPGTVSVAPLKGYSFYPWAPCHYKAVPGGSNSVTLTWDRRDRIGTQWISLPTAMSEASELYDLEICNGSGVVLRTVAGLTVPTYSYTSAQQVTDGFTPPLASIQFRVYQKSAVTGRGLTQTGTVNVS